MEARYEIGDLLGTGKFGAVFAGRDKRTQTPVAIKMDGANVLNYETSVLNFLRHRGVREIPSVFWFGKYQEYKCLVMTFYERCLGEIDAPTMKQCIRVLKHIHQHGVLHRDIKPANWMITSDGQIHLIDFGLSTFFLDGDGKHVAKCDADNIIGTPKFVSYYNHIGGNLSRRDDLISLGYMFLCRGNLRWREPTEQGTYGSAFGADASFAGTPATPPSREQGGFAPSVHMDASRPSRGADEVGYIRRRRKDGSPPASSSPLPWSHLRATTTDIHHPINIEMREMKQYERLKFPNREIMNYMKHCYSLEYDGDPQYDLLIELFY
jgi:serine/threonine protein kinase